MNGINVLMDILSGAVHAVDEVAYDIIVTKRWLYQPNANLYNDGFRIARSK